jgi:hypothetical protein
MGRDADGIALVVDYAGDTFPPGSRIVVGLDTDRNRATGSDRGADYLIDLEQSGERVVPSFERWRSGRYVPFELRSPVYAGGKAGSVLLVVCLCELGDPSAFRVFAQGVGGDGASADSMPDSGSQTVTVPIVASVNVAATFPVAGKTFSAEVNGIRLESDRSRLVAPQAATCSAKVGPKLLAPTGRCRWRLPAGSKGGTVVLRITVTYDGGTTTFRQPYPIVG